MYRAILFDVSDTLVDYAPNYAQIYGDRLRALGFAVDAAKAREIRRAVNWAIGRQSLREMQGAAALSTVASGDMKNRAALSCVAFPREMEAVYLQKMAEMPEPPQQMRVMPGVCETLAALKDRYALGIVSNHHVWLEDRLRALGLYDFFQTVVISEAVGIEKPDVRILELACRALGVPAAACLYVGDHPLDVLCAKRAGMACAWLAGDWCSLPPEVPYREDYRLAAISDLIGILR